MIRKFVSLYILRSDLIVKFKILIVENERIVADDIKLRLENLGNEMIGISGYR